MRDEAFMQLLVERGFFPVIIENEIGRFGKDNAT